jgi:hypothetical protein
VSCGYISLDIPGESDHPQPEDIYLTQGSLGT